mgnify:FL=1
MKKSLIFLIFVLILFSSCSKNVKNCKILPKIELKTGKIIESSEKIKNLAENSNTGAELSCNY